MEPFKFHSPTSIAIYAPPYSGKSILTVKILEHGDELFTTPPSFTVYCHKKWLPLFDEMKHTIKSLILHKGVPSPEQIEQWAQGKHFIVVLDDLQQVCEKDREVAEMLTVSSHHLNFTLIYLVRVVFQGLSTSTVTTTFCLEIIETYCKFKLLDVRHLGNSVLTLWMHTTRQLPFHGVTS